MIVHFDAFLAKTLLMIQFGPDDFGLYCSARERRNRFGTSLAARGTRAEIAAELDRVSLGKGPTRLEPLGRRRHSSRNSTTGG